MSGQAGESPDWLAVSALDVSGCDAKIVIVPCLAILELGYELPVKVVEYYFEELTEPWLSFSLTINTHEFSASNALSV